ncbi:MAG: hypothetical protein U9N49_00065 [Campylobacterota bacterium]|nr:hypothetical protein [Campylobacterota bacterium]
MLQLEIDNHSIEEYFKAPQAIEQFLQKAVKLDLLSVIESIQDDKLHQKSLDDIQNDNLNFYQDSKKLIDSLNA